MKNDAHDDYLWDGSGEPDPDVVRLETLLRPYAHRGRPLDPRFALARGKPRRAARIALQVFATAASLFLVAAAAWFASVARRPGWNVQALAGAPHIGGTRVDAPSTLPVGGTITTDAVSRARLNVASIGTVDVEPNSRVRLLRSRVGEQRMALDSGQIRATIWAPPKLFYVNTPSSTAIDLGCMYTLKVDERGSGVIQVENGWVAFQYDGRESFIPEGAICMTRPGRGPGTPSYSDAAEGVAEALTILDFAPTEDVRRAAALDTVLGSARPKDGLTLWHLLSRGSAKERSLVYDRMAALVPPPQGVTKDRVLRGDQRALDEWWGALGLDSASWWRILKTPWKQPKQQD